MAAIPVYERELFDAELLDAELGLNAAAPRVAFRQAVQRGRECLAQRFAAGVQIKDLVAARTWLFDQVLYAAWRHCGLAPSPFALVAVGGYGRGELHPGSDIDITVLAEPAARAAGRGAIETFLRLLWDSGLEVGQSVRSSGECREAAADLTVATNLMEARLLAGEHGLFAAMREAVGPQAVWPPGAFFEGKLAEQATRHRKFHGTAHNLEPNIKEGPGGLRDIHMIGWVAKRYFGAESLHGLVDHQFLTEEEYRSLDQAQAFLWRIRFALHTLAGRREDRLLFDHQRSVAVRLGYADSETGQLGVELFMKHYYRTVTELRRLNEMLLQLFREAILESGGPIHVEPLNRRFQIRNQYIEASDEGVFKRYPFALLEVFLLLQQHPEVLGVRASSIRLIRDHRYLIDQTFRKDLRTRSLFIEILRQPRRLGHELQRMHRYGVLEAYLPVFGAVSGLMQFDLFHAYTVDVHTLFVVQNLRRYTNPESEEAMPKCVRIMAQIPKPELLYIAGLFHDIAKGRGGDHSHLGAQFVTEFCEQHGLSHYDTRLVAWLVQHHLIMSTTAQRRDIADPKVINEFATLVGNRVRLDYLYLLTVADIRGTNPALWNGWKDALLTELYDGTLRALRRGVTNPIEKQEWIAETKGEALAALLRSNLSKADIDSVWEGFGEEYFLRHWPDEIAWHTKAIAAVREADLPLAVLRRETARGGTEVFVYARDQDRSFADGTRALDQLGLTIMDARIITSPRGYILNTYIVLEAATHEAIKTKARADEIVATLKARLQRADPLDPPPKIRPARQLRHFKIPTVVSFGADETNQRTVMEVVAADRPGILAQIAIAMRFCGARLQNAKIATFGERVEDIFYITDLENRPLVDPLKLECLRSSITSALAQ
ncbi:MAG: [protein-PII] uridylyltransferase [Gammaproteobacteria bacterium]